jgi:hypothetical protein
MPAEGAALAVDFHRCIARRDLTCARHELQKHDVETGFGRTT